MSGGKFWPVLAFYSGVAAIVAAGVAYNPASSARSEGVIPGSDAAEVTAPKKHVCVGLEAPATDVYHKVLAAKDEDGLLAIINGLQRLVLKEKDASYTVLQSAAEYLYNESAAADGAGAVPSLPQFIAAATAVCQQRFGTIADQENT